MKKNDFEGSDLALGHGKSEIRKPRAIKRKKKKKEGGHGKPGRGG